MFGYFSERFSLEVRQQTVQERQEKVLQEESGQVGQTGTPEKSEVEGVAIGDQLFGCWGGRDEEEGLQGLVYGQGVERYRIVVQKCHQKQDVDPQIDIPGRRHQSQHSQRYRQAHQHSHSHSCILTADPVLPAVLPIHQQQFRDGVYSNFILEQFIDRQSAPVYRVDVSDVGFCPIAVGHTFGEGQRLTVGHCVGVDNVDFCTQRSGVEDAGEGGQHGAELLLGAGYLQGELIFTDDAVDVPLDGYVVTPAVASALLPAAIPLLNFTNPAAPVPILTVTIIALILHYYSISAHLFTPPTKLIKKPQSIPTIIAHIIAGTEVKSITTDQTLTANQTVQAITKAGRQSQSGALAGVVDHVVACLTRGAVGVVEAGQTVGTAAVAGESRTVEVKVLFFALKTDSEVVAVRTTQFARLASQPRKRYVESAFGTGSVAVKANVVLAAGLQAYIAFPPQAPRPGGIQTVTLTHQRVTAEVEYAAMSDERVAIDAGQTVIWRIDANVAANLTGKAQRSCCIQIGLRQALALLSVVLEEQFDWTWPGQSQQMGLKPMAVQPGRQVKQLVDEEQVLQPEMASVQFLQMGAPGSQNPGKHWQRPASKQRFQPQTQDLQFVERGPMQVQHVVGQGAMVSGVSWQQNEADSPQHKFQTSTQSWFEGHIWVWNRTQPILTSTLGLELLKMQVRAGRSKVVPIHPLIPYSMAKGRKAGSGLFQIARGSATCTIVPAEHTKSVQFVAIAYIVVQSMSTRSTSTISTATLVLLMLTRQLSLLQGTVSMQRAGQPERTRFLKPESMDSREQVQLGSRAGRQGMKIEVGRDKQSTLTNSLRVMPGTARSS